MEDGRLDAEFWLERWRNQQIGFHESTPNAMLVDHVDRLELAPGDRIFLPLCGKTLDIGWLLAKGFRACGVELSKAAVEQLFAELRVDPEVSALGELTLYRARGLDIFVGDVFALTAALLAPVDAIYDRAALVALPDEMRRRYSAHLCRITESARQLLICLEYDQDLMPGPPFSITGDDVAALYGNRYRITRLASSSVPGGLKGFCPATETAWLLRPPA